MTESSHGTESGKNGKRYLMVLSAGARRISPTHFAVESAFAEHLRVLKHLLAPRFSELVVAMGDMSERDYERERAALAVVDEAAEGIRFVPVFPHRANKLAFLKRAPQMLKTLRALVADSALVHSHLSYDLFRPVEVTASALALALGKKVIAITDMDNRGDAEMNRRLGRWGRRTYWMCKYLYDPIRDAQQRAYVKLCDLVLFKELQQVEDYGRGAPHVRLFLDPNFSPHQVAGDDVVRAKVKELDDERAPLRLLYFGRLVEYKGVRPMIEAVALARKRGAHVRFDIMGRGPDGDAFRALVQERGIDDIVDWLEPRAYGEQFFDVLRRRHLLLACPLSADTPRSTWDALASATPILAFDTPFYTGIAKYTGAVDVTPWPEVEPLAERIVELARDKRQLIPLVRKAVAAAHANSGDEWMRRRVEWVEELFAPPPAPSPASSSSEAPAAAE